MGIPHSHLAPTDPQHPRPVGFCDRCGTKRYLDDLPFQFDWRGPQMQSLGIRVCKDRCLDKPQPNGRKPIIIGPDPKPLKDPRPGFAASQMQGNGIVGTVTILPVNQILED